tara:strand:+ start:100 stop:447 length:348 start_codon:yes stop_codon:yes gene_type:complete
MTIQALHQQAQESPATISFEQVMTLIDTLYYFTATSFTNGGVVNEVGTNEGSCKIFAFAQLNGFNEMETLALFGKYYRDDVLGNPSGDDHANIRNFILDGWLGIQFNTEPLTLKG